MRKTSRLIYPIYKDMTNRYPANNEKGCEKSIIASRQEDDSEIASVRAFRVVGLVVHLDDFLGGVVVIH